MPNKILKLLVFIFVVPIFLQVSSFGQVPCESAQIFKEKLCAGDEVNSQEKELYRIVNEYRKQNGLTQIPMSESLSIVANRHLLDLRTITYITHSWSNCRYEIKDNTTWNCIFEAPKRLNVGYAGNGYENLYRNLKGSATPPLALEAWKKSELHNSLILNLNSFKDTKFDAFGIAIDGQYAALWFGSSGNRIDLSANQVAGLGVTFEKAVSGLTNVVSIEKKSSTGESEFWSGASPDKSVMLQVSGRKEDVSEATIGIRVRLEKGNRLSQKNRNILGVFLTNLASEWTARDVWLDASVKKLLQNPKQPESATQGSKIITLGVDAEGYLSITVKPNKKPTAREF